MVVCIICYLGDMCVVGEVEMWWFELVIEFGIYDLLFDVVVEL